MGWTRISPGRFQRGYSEDELFMKLSGDLVPGCNNWAVWVTGRISIDTRLSNDILNSLRRAWTRLRYQQPLIAAQVCRLHFLYTIPSEDDLQEWLTKTFFLEGCETVDAYLAKPRNTPFATLHYFPHSREILLAAPHCILEGPSLLMTFNNLIRILADDSPVPAFGDEWTRLPDSCPEIGGLYQRPIHEAESLVRDLLKLPAPKEEDDANSSGVLTPLSDSSLLQPSCLFTPSPSPSVFPGTPNTEYSTQKQETYFPDSSRAATCPSEASSRSMVEPGPKPIVATQFKRPGAVRRIRFSYSQKNSSMIIAACKKRGISFNAALHAALKLALDEHPDFASKGSLYSDIMPYNYRPSLPQSTELGAAGYPTGLYIVGLTFIMDKKNATFLKVAKKLAKCYRSPVNVESVVKTYLEWENRVAKSVKNVPDKEKDVMLAREMSLPRVSPLGVFEKYVTPKVQGSRYSIEILDMDVGLLPMLTSMVFYPSSYKGSSRITTNFNAAYWGEDFVRDLMRKVEDVMLKGLGLRHIIGRRGCRATAKQKVEAVVLKGLGLSRIIGRRGSRAARRQRLSKVS